MIEIFTGKRFERLEVLRAGPSNNGRQFWCQCDCGSSEVLVSAGNLRNGHAKSCGCLRRELGRKSFQARATHGGSRTPAYNSWDSMLQRCYNEKNEAYKHYGARGITVCPEWRESFAVFRVDMGPRPEGTSLERENNDLGYFKGNCVWATQSRQMRNTRRTVFVELNGLRMSLAEAVEVSGLTRAAVENRIKRGWPADAVFSAPLHSRRPACPVG